MSKFKISQIQFQALSKPEDNAKLLKKNFIKTKNFKPDLICTPECSNIITSDKNHLFKFSTLQKECPIIFESKEYAKKNNVNIHLGSLLLKIKGKKKLVNRSILINNKGFIQKIYDKIHMFDVNINNTETHRESHSFIKGDKVVTSNISGIKLGFSVCYDLRFPNLYRKLAKKGAQIILIPAAFTVPTGKAHWETLIKARSIENSVFVVATNMCGTHHGQRKTYGFSLVSDPWGEVLNNCKSRPKIINTIINLKKITEVRKKIPSIYLD